MSPDLFILVKALDRVSPLLFLFAIEPLAIAIWNSWDIKGIQICERENRLSLFA